MIPLHPLPPAAFACPGCRDALEVRGWYMPGMRCLADLSCPGCHAAYYGDLAMGHGACYPMLLDQASGAVSGGEDAPWFAEWLRASYADRRASPVAISTERFRPVRRALLLNCLDGLYGHGLLKLLNAQAHLDLQPEYDLVVLVPRILRWLVPEGAAEIWTVDLPLARGTEWNDWLAQEIARRVAMWGSCELSVAFSHPHPADITIERFSRVAPFPLEAWELRLERPAVTFILRDDRIWAPEPRGGWARRMRQGTNRLRQLAGAPVSGARNQIRAVIETAERLRRRDTALDLAVAGVGRRGGLPAWIRDLRVSSPDAAQEQALCERYARSHVVIGVHGSNMLLPSAHAGAVVELVPEDRWGNTVQDWLIRQDDQREMLFRYRSLPLATPPDTVAAVAASILWDFGPMRRHMQRDRCAHAIERSVSAWVGR